MRIDYDMEEYSISLMMSLIKLDDGEFDGFQTYTLVRENPPPVSPGYKET